MNYTSIINLPLIRPLSFGWQVSLRTLSVLLSAVIVSLVALYVFQMSALTQASFSVSRLEKELMQADKEFKSLQLKFSNESSLRSLEAVLLASGYERVSKIRYIQILSSEVATAK